MLFVQEQEGEREGKKITFIKKLLYLALCLFYLHPWGCFMKFSFWKQGMQNSERLNNLHKDYWTPYTVFITVTSIPTTIFVILTAGELFEQELFPQGCWLCGSARSRTQGLGSALNPPFKVCVCVWARERRERHHMHKQRWAETDREAESERWEVGLAQIQKRRENSKKHASQGSGKESRNGEGMVRVEVEFAVATISRLPRGKV